MMNERRIIPRSEWGAKVPTFIPMPGVPVGKLFVHHSVTNPTLDPFFDMRRIEEIGDERFGRFSYNYVIHNPTGVIMEGAGFTIGAHTKDHNSTALSMCVIGNLDIHKLHEPVQESMLWLYDELVNLKQLKRDAFVRPHSAVKATGCPGNALELWLPSFIEFTRNPQPDEPVIPERDIMGASLIQPTHGPHADRVWVNSGQFVSHLRDWDEAIDLVWNEQLRKEDVDNKRIIPVSPIAFDRLIIVERK